MIEVPESLEGLVAPLQAIVDSVARQVDLAQRGGAAQHERFEDELSDRLDDVHLAAEAFALAALLHRLVRKAQRRKALDPERQVPVGPTQGSR